MAASASPRLDMCKAQQTSEMNTLLTFSPKGQPTVRQERNDDSPLLASATAPSLASLRVRTGGRSSHNQICAKDTQTNGTAVLSPHSLLKNDGQDDSLPWPLGNTLLEFVIAKMVTRDQGI